MKLVDFFHYKDFILRPITVEDMESVVDLVNEAYSYQDETKGEPRTNLQKIKKYATETVFFVIENENRIEGCVYIEPNEESLHFGLLTVAHQLRGKGLAQAILTAIESYAKGEHYKTVGMAYMSLAPWLKAYYEKHGYSVTGEIGERGPIKLVWMDKKLDKI